MNDPNLTIKVNRARALSDFRDWLREQGFASICNYHRADVVHSRIERENNYAEFFACGASQVMLQVTDGHSFQVFTGIQDPTIEGTKRDVLAYCEAKS